MGGKSSGSKNSTSTTRVQLDPRMNALLYGTEDKTNKKTGAVTPGTDGMYDYATNLYKQGPSDYYGGPTYAGLNGAQNTAINNTINYAGSDAANAGANAYSSVGQTLVDRLNSPQQWDAAPYQAMTAAQAQGPTADYSGALNQALSGNPNNPWLDQQAQGITDKITRNYQENIAPQTRAGAEMAGQYGSSRQGIAEGLQQRGMNQDITNSLANLYGSANESAQNRAASTAASLAGQQQSTNLANAGFQQQAGLANQGAYQQAINTGLGANQFNTSAALQGAGAINTGSQLPYQNYQQMLNAGALQQQDQQGQYNANLAQWDYNANKDANWLNNYASIISPGAGLGSSTSATTPMYKNNSGALGGALGGAGIGYQAGGGWGALAGGIFGGLLGGQ